MNVKNIDVLNALPILKEMNTTKMKLGVSYKVRKLIDECNIVTTAYEEQRKELLEKYAILDPKKNVYNFPKDDDGKALAAYNEANQALVEGEVEMEFPTINIDDLPEVEVEPAATHFMDWFIEQSA